MNRHLNRFRALFFIAIAIMLGGCDNTPDCDLQGKPETEWFVQQWNEEVSGIRVDTWEIPTFQTPTGHKKQSNFHSLVGPNLYIVLNAEGPCLESIDVRAKRDMDISMASLVAWAKLLKIFGPHLSPQETKRIIDEELRLTQEGLQVNNTAIVGRYKFTFTENLSGNTMRVEPLGDAPE